MTSKAIDRIHKRRKWPVDLGDGNSCWIRTMLKSELRERDTEFKAAPMPDATDEDKAEAESVNADLRAYFVLGSILIEDDCSPMYQREKDEPAAVFAKRVEGLMADVPEENKIWILREWGRASAVPDVDKLAKN